MIDHPSKQREQKGTDGEEREIQVEKDAEETHGDEKRTSGGQEASSQAMDHLVPMDPRMKQYWTKVIMKGSKTLKDFQTSVRQSDEYVQHIISRYKSAWTDVLGSDTPFNPRALRGLQDLGGAHRETEAYSDTRMRQEIKATAEFRQKYTNLIQSCAYLTVEGLKDGLPASDLEGYLKKFQTEDAYTLDSLRVDLSVKCPHQFLLSTIEEIDEDISPQSSPGWIRLAVRRAVALLNSRPYSILAIPVILILAWMDTVVCWSW